MGRVVRHKCCVMTFFGVIGRKGIIEFFRIILGTRYHLRSEVFGMSASVTYLLRIFPFLFILHSDWSAAVFWGGCEAQVLCDGSFG